MINSWQFAHAHNMSITGINNSGEDQFSDDIYASLAREVIQNSLDAVDAEVDAPVEVKFEVFEMDVSDVPGIGYFRESAIPQAKLFKQWRENKDTTEYLNRFASDIADGKKLKVLRISDFNTVGLGARQFESLISEGYSVKSDAGSQGNKGIGKAAPFAASNLRMVFYNSVSKESGNKAAGVVHFMSFPYSPDDGRDITEAKGYYRPADSKLIDGHVPLSSFERTVYGTDVYVVSTELGC